MAMMYLNKRLFNSSVDTLKFVLELHLMAESTLTSTITETG